MATKVFSELVEASFPIKDDNQILVSQKQTASKFESKAIELSSIYQQLNEELPLILDVGSMAYENTADWALKIHDHDVYTSADYISERMTGELQKFLTLKHDSVVEELSVKITREQDDKTDYIIGIIEKAQPKLGEIRNVAPPSAGKYDFEKCNPRSQKFIGWVLANEEDEYDIADFKLSNEITNVFKCSGEKFAVPSLSNFCRIDCSTTCNVYTEVRESVHMLTHSHNVVVDGARVTTTLTGISPSCFEFTTQTDFQSYGHTVHNGTGNHESAYVDCTNSVDSDAFNNSNIQTENFTPSISTYPSHNLLPTLVFVGPSRWSYEYYQK